MAAYAALVSVMHIIEQIQHHPRPPISLDKNQVEPLIENVTFLQNFLEDYSYRVHNDDLESCIANAAHAAEDVLESHIVDRIVGGATSHGENIKPDDLFYQDLQKVIQDMDLIKKEVMEIKENMGSVQNHIVRRSPMPKAASLSQSAMVGFDDDLIELMDKLTRQPSSERQIFPIVGMGGMGKTTLAQTVYEHSVIVQHFDIRAWTTISQEYRAREILLQLLPGQGHYTMSELELGEMLYKTLWGRRYLIVMDDMWNIDAWEKVKSSFPNDNNGSGIIITTRISNIAMHLTRGRGLEMNFLNEDISWSLLCKIVFEEGGCPNELEAMGKKIARNCKGLPLSLVVIGGLLAKSNWTQEYWEYIAKNLNSIVNLENNEHCLNLLYLSYNHLPVHLKPCFLYFGVFRENCEILVSKLIELWVAEGFLKPISGKSLEEVAEEYLKELYDRNLILVSDWECNGKVKSFRIHDLLIDLCLREAEKEKFLCVMGQHRHSSIPQGLNTCRRFALHNDKSKMGEVFNALRSASHARSLINIFDNGVSKSQNFRLLRLLTTNETFSLGGIFSQLVNLRLVTIKIRPLLLTTYRLSLSHCLLWNLHTITIHGGDETTLDIWKMPRLRHVNIDRLYLGRFSTSTMHRRPQGNFVLENLQTLKLVCNFRCSKKMAMRIPNIKALEILYTMKRFIGSIYGVNNLVRLQKLEKLLCWFFPEKEPINRNDLLLNLTFPHSLKELDLRGSRLHWEDISIKIGSLPFLQVLKLDNDSFIGPEWETVEGQFCSLKHLELGRCDLECWKTDNTHFPCLEELVLRCLKKLKEIPSSIGDIPTLKLMKIVCCGYSAIVSAKEIHDEQEELANEDLQFQVMIPEETYNEVRSWASNNFIVQVASFYDSFCYACRSSEARAT